MSKPVKPPFPKSGFYAFYAVVIHFVFLRYVQYPPETVVMGSFKTLPAFYSSIPPCFWPI